ncbi:UNVERIFIED_CONTAM: Ferritin-1, chloroplastic [Sesamum radiatum]|uniref:Ferritin n=1 Tax=Sesamum radiatum TaxID=300843 RepID=A0AAW2KTL9_SESRA
MFLEAISAVSLPSLQGSAAALGPLTNSSTSPPFSTSFSPKLTSLSVSSSSSSFSGLVLAKKRDNGLAAGASNETVGLPLTGVLFQPFEEVKKDELMVPTAPELSLARQGFSEECEAAVNEQINVEYCVSYVYHALYAYFDRDNVALKGLAKSNKRGGRVKLLSIEKPPVEFDDAEKGDALYAMELALCLEKLTNEKLLKLHSIADENNDPQLADFIESEFLEGKTKVERDAYFLPFQVEAIKKISEYVAQRRVGKGHGVWHFDQMLLQEGDGAM